MSKGGALNHPILEAIMLAKYTNQAHGAPVIAAWDVTQLPDEWLDAMIALTTELPQIEKGYAVVEAHLSAWRAKHPTYRKH